MALQETLQFWANFAATTFRPPFFRAATTSGSDFRPPRTRSRAATTSRTRARPRAGAAAAKCSTRAEL